MLTISRKEDEAVVIQTSDGDEIRIVVHDFSTNKIKISFDASSEYTIQREELLPDSLA